MEQVSNDDEVRLFWQRLEKQPIVMLTDTFAGGLRCRVVWMASAGAPAPRPCSSPQIKTSRNQPGAHPPDSRRSDWNCDDGAADGQWCQSDPAIFNLRRIWD